jgi:hypothetical protein
MIFREPVSREGEELPEPLWEIFSPWSVLRATQGRGRHGVCTRRAAYAEVDPPRMQGLQDFEGLRHLERGVIREHDPARADPDPPGRAGDVADHDLRRGARDGGQVVVLGQPVPFVAEPVGEPGQIERVE